MTWTVSRIKTKARRLSGRLNTNRLSDATLLEYINDFYTEKLPAELNLRELEDWYEFNTSVNDDDYAIQATDFTLNAPAYINGSQVQLFDEASLFFSIYPAEIITNTAGTGDASTVTFAYTIPNTPIQEGSLVVDDATETFTDNGTGTLTGDTGGTGTVNYTTGAISVTFNSAPSDGQTIRSTYEYFSTSAPQAILFDQEIIHLRPVPNEVYSIKIRTTTKPAAFTSDSDVPTYDDWGVVIAYGAALDILSDYEGISEAAKIQNGYETALAIAGRRFLKQSTTNRAVPTF